MTDTAESLLREVCDGRYQLTGDLSQRIKDYFASKPAAVAMELAKKLPAMPMEIQEWCWHMDLHVTEHDVHHAGKALRAAWPHVSKWLHSVVGAATTDGAPFAAPPSRAAEQQSEHGSDLIDGRSF